MPSLILTLALPANARRRLFRPAGPLSADHRPASGGVPGHAAGLHRPRRGSKLFRKCR